MSDQRRAKNMTHKETSHETADRRARRTRRSLSKALIELILEKRYDAITVQNVIDRADVGRSTFYAHFRDKEDLLLSDWEGLLDRFVQRIRWENLDSQRLVPVRELFCHLQEAHHFYRALARSRKTDLIFKTGVDYMGQGIEDSLTAWLADQPPPSIPLSVLAHYPASGIFNLLKWWLAHTMSHT